MNLLIRRIAVFALLLPVFFACEDPKDIGLDLEPQKDNFGVLFTENLTVQTSTVLVDSVRTHSSPYFLVGRYQDPHLGTITAQSFLQVRFGTAFDLGTTPVLDSVVLILDYDYDYGYTGQSQTLSVHRLTDSLRRKIYYNSDELNYNATPVAAKTFVANTKRDTLTIRLDDAVGNYLMNFSGKTEQEFLDAFYGLALVGGENDNGAIIAPAVTTTSTASVLRLYYKNSGATTQSRYDFFLDGLNFNHIQSDRTGILAGLKNPYDSLLPSSTGELTYVQAGIGLMTKVEFPDIQKLKENGNIGINRAELVITPITGTIVSAITPPPALTLYQIGQDNKIFKDSTIGYVPLLADFRNEALYAPYNPNRKQYTFLINRYITGLLNGTATNNGVFISVPSVSLQLGVPSFERSVDRVVIGSNKHPEPIKLRIYYTEVSNQ